MMRVKHFCKYNKSYTFPPDTQFSNKNIVCSAGPETQCHGSLISVNENDLSEILQAMTKMAFKRLI